jgi:hypothetical protein
LGSDDAMDEKPSGPEAAKTDLAAALRRAREENAERSEAVSDLRDIEAGRLALLESALKAVVKQAPPDVDMFDLTLTHGEHPRLFLDMIAFIDMGRDRRTYRFFQDTMHGRVLIAESHEIGRIVAAVTNYVARRLVERERALAAGCASKETRQTAVWPMRVTELADGAPEPEPTPAGDVAPNAHAVERKARRRSLASRLADAMAFLLMTLGSITLIGLLALGAYVAWTIRLRDLWAHWIGAPPF